MKSAAQQKRGNQTGFRLKALVAMMIVVVAMAGIGLYLEQRNLKAEVSHELQSQFQGELALLHQGQQVRHAALEERCRALVRRPRIHAALEDNALDLLYPSAEDELHDVMAGNAASNGIPSPTLHAVFYRFLNSSGRVITPPATATVGSLGGGEEAQLALPSVPTHQQLGYVVQTNAAGAESVAEIIAVPIISTETLEPIAALVLGFTPPELTSNDRRNAMQSGILVGGRLHLPSLPKSMQTEISSAVSHAAAKDVQNSFTIDIAGVPHLIFFNHINAGSLYSPAYEVCLFPLTNLLARQRQLRWQILGAGALMLLVGFMASHYLSARLSVPVEKLAVDSEVNRAGRERAETALEQTNVELQRSVRFSADASHQLKTPVTVLRAGLEELLAQPDLAPEVREEISQLLRQTGRLTGVIEDLLLLSRMDAGRLQLNFTRVNLSHLVEAELDDLSARPDGRDISIEASVAPDLEIEGEKRYTTMIVRNLLENAGKYNRNGGKIRVNARPDAGAVVLTIGNTGKPIPATAKEHIFERFHRGSAAENVPGHGLGLNLARELARLHGGDVRLLGSHESWTEFEVRFRAATPTTVKRAAPA